MTVEEMVAVARDAALESYSPYSKFRVGALVITEDNVPFTGANVENASYPVSTCAEETAMATAVSSGARRISTVVVACVDAVNLDGAYPCGRCRQIMSEFGVERVIVTAGEGSSWREHTFDELLPYRFSL